MVVAACMRTVRGLLSELPLGPEDGMPEICVASFDNLHTVPRLSFASASPSVGRRVSGRWAMSGTPHSVARGADCPARAGAETRQRRLQLSAGLALAGPS